MFSSRLARPRIGLRAFTRVVALGLVIFAASPVTTLGAQTSDQSLPGGGAEVRLGRATWDTGWFQAEVVAQLLRELDYVIEGPTTTDNDDLYRGIAMGSIDLWANGWFPLHQGLLDESEGSAVEIGFEVRGGALQGYMIDTATVERFGIETMADLRDPEIAELFDINGDGKADLIGCNQGWACGPIVEHHLESYGLLELVDQVRGDYGPLMRATVERFEAGEPVLFYTFTPNWTVGELVPGRDVVWIPVPFPSLPADIVEQEPATLVPEVAGCLADPCSMGFAPNDIRAVANARFLTDHPAIESLLTQLEIPLDDILEQNARMVAGEDSADDIERHATQWIETNRQQVELWLDASIEAHVAAGLPLSPRTVSGADARASTGPLRVVTRLDAPFVTYDGGAYHGFTIELLQLIADDIGAEVDVYAVNTSAKLIDDVNRGEADLGVGAFAITSRREEAVDFTQPYFDSGLQILVADRADGFLGGRPGAVARAVFSVDLFALCLVLLVILVLAAHVVWLTERRHNPDFPASYRAGIWESLWWAAVTATTVGYGDKTPTGVAGRVFGLFWMFSGLFVLAYFTAGIATAFTIDELTNTIDDPADLRGRAVAVPADTPASEYLAGQGIGATEFETAEQAYDALHDGEVEAVVHDAAILQHFVATDGRGGVDVTGSVFAERGFGFAVQAEAELAETINRSLLVVIESGDYDALQDEWFGAATGN